jgi:hypothetical protein
LYVSEHPESKYSDDLDIVTTQASAQDVFFDSVIGHIEDILMGKNIIHFSSLSKKQNICRSEAACLPYYTFYKTNTNTVAP